jgi:hypothetical protein
LNQQKLSYFFRRQLLPNRVSKKYEKPSVQTFFPLATSVSATYGTHGVADIFTIRGLGEDDS